MRGGVTKPSVISLNRSLLLHYCMDLQGIVSDHSSHLFCSPERVVCYVPICDGFVSCGLTT